MGEKAVLTVKAHVFQIDPETKKKWLPSSSTAVPVAYYHDPTRKTYRIIAIDGGKALVNSTVTANMTFTKTSPKFGQWSDHRANTVYGLGFGSEKDLVQFSDKFMEAKSAAKALLEERKKQRSLSELSSTPTPAVNSDITRPSSTNPTTITSTNTNGDEVMSPTRSTSTGDESGIKSDKEPDIKVNEVHVKLPHPRVVHPPISSTSLSSTVTTIVTAASTSSISTSTTSTPVNSSVVNGTEKHNDEVSSNPVSRNPSGKQIPLDQQIDSLKFENSKLKVALASSAQNVKKWETEMQTLRNNNAMLTAALEESTLHVAEWKRQLQKYKEECDQLKKKVSELEATNSPEEFESMKKENEELKDCLSSVQTDLESKREEVTRLQGSLSATQEKLNEATREKQALQTKLSESQSQISEMTSSNRAQLLIIREKHSLLGEQLQHLVSLHQEMSSNLQN